MTALAKLAALALLATSSAAFAQTATPAPAPAAGAGTWAQNHPRRAEVNARLANQNKRIDAEKASGQITGAQAKALHQDDRGIRQEERTMASTNGGHITKTEQRALNQQENSTSKAIGK